MKQIIYCIGILSIFLTLSCSSPTTAELDIRDNLNKEINLSMFQQVYHRDTTLQLSDCLARYEYLSVVYLKDGCDPCYPKYIDWHRKLDSLAAGKHFSLLFIIEGNINSTYQKFISEVRHLEPLQDHYYTVMDTGYHFLDGNKDIPSWILETPLLLNRNKQIKIIGSPFVNENMTRLLLDIIGQ